MSSGKQVLIIGGGPAGSTAAALLAKSGIKVRLLEREVFPRYHIGESLLPSCKSLLKLSGALDKVEEHGFVIKRGSLFRWGSDEWVLDWAKLVDAQAWTWEVERDKYDEILLRNAADQGAEVVEGATVKRVVFDDDGRPTAVEWVGRDSDTVHTERFDYLIDASGRAGVLANQHFKIRQSHEVFQNIAIWGYWRGAKLLPGTPEGGFNGLSSPNGWYWHIPLTEDRFSIGFVTHKNTFAERRKGFDSLKDFYLDRIRACPPLHGLLDDATLLDGDSGDPIRAEQDFSYVAERFCGPGYLMIGDSACFLDPLLSTGVHLAQFSALLGAASVSSIFNGDLSEEESLAFFEYAYRRAYTRLLVLVSRMYERYRGADDFFWQSQRLVHEQVRYDQPVRNFTEIIAGMTDLREAETSDTRALTQLLLADADEAQVTAPQGPDREHFPGLEVSVLWNIYRDPAGVDAKMKDIQVVTEPRVGLVRQPA
ncbi:NAD(P)/FAD-dependent oxidoreductase [Saccharothrix australiensis]|uniref:Flavin-dependent dehydrogenase n=1 Tax=Saccharothrix australiensis TaxID=2072 RepID=A0A495W818_9PSEU|nr:NAD(P)/FAD-dependent oxidoreductase [Saccharothrix australiensis]RKT57424.1 flavin-dependent dehydrogenase [Saccharothrix australiensis]